MRLGEIDLCCLQPNLKSAISQGFKRHSGKALQGHGFFGRKTDCRNSEIGAERMADTWIDKIETAFFQDQTMKVLPNYLRS